LHYSLLEERNKREREFGVGSARWKDNKTNGHGGDVLHASLPFVSDWGQTKRINPQIQKQLAR